MSSSTTYGRFIKISFAILLLAPGLAAQVQFDITSIMRPSDPAPVPAEVSTATSPSVDDNGQVAFVCDDGICLKSADRLVVVAGFGDPAPGGTFIGARSPALNAFGQIAFEAITTPFRRNGIFVFSEGKIDKIVEDGDPAPGGGTFSIPFQPSVSLNAAGQIAFVAFTQAGSGLYLFSDGEILHLAGQGDAAPGGGAFSSFNIASVNSAGQVAFLADVASGASGIFLFSEGSITKVVRQGDPAPDGGAFSFFSYRPVALNDAGEVGFAASSSLPNSGAMFLFSEGRIVQLVRQGELAPGGDTFLFIDSPSLNGMHQVAFRASLAGAPFLYGIFLITEGHLSVAARPGMASPEGDIFVSCNDSPSMNEGGEVVFGAQLANNLGGIYSFSLGKMMRIAGQADPVERQPQFSGAFPQAINATTKVILSSTAFPGGSGLFDESHTAIVRAGDQAPGGGAFTYFDLSNVVGAAVNDSGQVAFRGGLSTRNNGLYLFDAGTLTKIVREGDPTPLGGTFFSLDGPALNNRAQVAFGGYALPPGGNGLFLYSDGQLTPLVRQGESAPGGGTFYGFLFVSMNDLAQVAFWASVTAPGRSGIFLWSDGHVLPIAQTGDSAPDDGTFDFSSPNSSLGPSLNAAGQVAFGATLSTGHAGVFLFTEGTIVKIAGPGDPRPEGGTFFEARMPSLNDAGQVAFSGAPSPSFGGSVYMFSGGTIGKVAGAGDPAPDGGTFAFAYSPTLNAQGQVAFAGFLFPLGTGAFLATPKSMRDGQPPNPGVLAGPGFPQESSSFLLTFWTIGSETQTTWEGTVPESFAIN